MQLFREALVRHTDTTFEEFYNGSREVQHISLGVNILLTQVILYHEQSHITDDFGGRSNLNQIAEHHGYSMIHILDFFPTVNESQGLSLLLQIGVLAAGHFVAINLGIGEVFGFIRSLVIGTHSFPIAGHFVQGIHIEAWLTRMTA